MKETSSLSEKVDIDRVYSKWSSLTYFEKLVLKEEAVEFNKKKDEVMKKDDRQAEERNKSKEKNEKNEKRLKHKPENKKKVDLNYSFYKKKYGKTSN